MNAHRFDALAKSIPLAANRRQVISALLSWPVHQLAWPRSSAAQTRCSHKLDCGETEICGSRGCRECPQGDAACPIDGDFEGCLGSESRETCPFWFCSHRSSDPDNCGGCGIVCPSGVCEAGICTQTQSSVSQENLDYLPITVEYAGRSVPYQASILWSPLILPLPDGNAWAFFTAQAELGNGTDLSNYNVFAAKFDAELNSWSVATSLPGEISFGPTGVVDDLGIVHLVYTLRASLDPSSYSILAYIRATPEGGWTTPSLVNSSEFAGHQLSPDLAIDPMGGLHLAWQDQRSVTAQQRTLDPSNADVFVSDLNADGLWTEPLQISVRTVEENNGSRPQMLASVDRLVLIWSVYSTTEDIGLDSAIQVQWTTRSISEPQGWAEPQTLFERDGTLIGGRFWMLTR